MAFFKKALSFYQETAGLLVVLILLTGSAFYVLMGEQEKSETPLTSIQEEQISTEETRITDFDSEYIYTDREFDIFDYNNIVSCIYGSKLPRENCSPAKHQASDLNKDTVVDNKDLDILYPAFTGGQEN